VPIEGTAGAGDAHLAGVIAGLASGLALPVAQEIGGLVAAMSITSPHSIDDRVRPPELLRFAADHMTPVSDAVRSFLAAAPAGREEEAP
jgi:sugar/nucleoside kinase (ribokinase family)